jgi:hypothetical protein
MRLPHTSGDLADFVRRLRLVLPAAWFPVPDAAVEGGTAPVLDGLLSGIGHAWTYCYGLVTFAAAQARLATATGGFLDLAAADFFGSGLVRLASESDDTYRTRVRTNMLLARGTRTSISAAMARLIGEPPLIIEPRSAVDCGAISSAVAIQTTSFYGQPGLRYGSTAMPFQFQAFVAGPNAVVAGTMCMRASAATFLDQKGLMQSAAPDVVRPLFQDGVLAGPLLEERSYNLIRDSEGWSFLRSVTANSPANVRVAPEATSRVWAQSQPIEVHADPSLAVPVLTVTLRTSPGSVTGSVWVLVPDGLATNYVSLTLACDNGRAKTVTPELSSSNRWQRLVVSLDPEDLLPHAVTLTLSVENASSASAALLTQCWQIEPGSTATSYIPTRGHLGLRQADIGVKAESSNPLATSIATISAVCSSFTTAGATGWIRLVN